MKPPLALSMLDKHLLNVGYFPQGRQNERVNFLFIPKITESQMMYIPNGLFPQIYKSLTHPHIGSFVDQHAHIKVFTLSYK